MKVKICGLKTKQQVDTVVNCGGDFVGFVFAASHRRVTPETVKKITVDVPKRVKKVGVFVSPSVAEVENTIQQAKLDMVQIHGILAAPKFSVPLIRAIAVDHTLAKTLQENSAADYLLFDAPPQQFAGGNGRTFDWETLQVDSQRQQKIIIAGGLTVDNVQTVQHLMHPYAVDVSSGVETNGVKDQEKMIAFIQKAKEEFDV